MAKGWGFSLGWWKGAKIRLQRCLPNSVTILKTTDLYTFRGWIARYILRRLSSRNWSWLKNQDDDGAIHMPLTVSMMGKQVTNPDVGQHSWAWPRLPPPDILLEFLLWAALRPLSPVPTQPPLLLVQRKWAPDRTSETTHQWQKGGVAEETKDNFSLTLSDPASSPLPHQKPPN